MPRLVMAAEPARVAAAYAAAPHLCLPLHSAFTGPTSATAQALEHVELLAAFQTACAGEP